MGQSEDVNSSIREDIGEGVDFHDSSSPDAVFLTTRARIHLALIQFKEGVLAKTKWVNPLMMVVTLSSAILVTDFKQFLALPANVWKAMFVFGLLLSVGWLLRAIYGYVDNREKSEIDYVIDQLKTDQ